MTQRVLVTRQVPQRTPAADEVRREHSARVYFGHKPHVIAIKDPRKRAQVGSGTVNGVNERPQGSHLRPVKTQDRVVVSMVQTPEVEWAPRGRTSPVSPCRW